MQVDSDTKRARKPKRTNGEAITVADLARRIGVSRQIVHRQVKALEADGRLRVDRVGRKLMVDPAAFEAARSLVKDPARAAQTKAKPAVDTTPPANSPEVADKSYQDLRRERERYDMQLKRLQYQRERGEVVPIKDVEQALIDCGHRIVGQFELAMQWSEELTAAAKKGGVAAVRTLLRAKVAIQRESVTRELAAAIADDDATKTDDES